MASAVLGVICGRCSARKYKTKLPRICFSAILEFVTDFCKSEPLWAELCNFFGDVSTFDILRNYLMIFIFVGAYLIEIDDIFCRETTSDNKIHEKKHFGPQPKTREKSTNQTTKNNTRKKRIRPPKQTQFRPPKKKEETPHLSHPHHPVVWGSSMG